MADLLDGLAQYLAARGHGTYDPTGASGSIFIEAMPSTPETCVVLTIYDDGGEADTRLGYDDVPLQVRVRGTTDPRVSRTLAQDIRAELHGLGEVVLPDGSNLILARANQAAASMGTDGNRRHEHVVNLRLHVRSVTAHRV
ncbi:minor capsid protein [Streptomyces sp. NPDC002812]|uniref:minor capsid protein n=1 Tax=Streptomyces sp. NPDC002812 TaxID=3154434 RepID=UPI00331FC33A